MEHAQREAALRARDLVVIELHGIDGSASELIVLRIRPEDRGQQHSRVVSLRMNFHTNLEGDRSTVRGQVLRALRKKTKVLHSTDTCVARKPSSRFRGRPGRDR